MNLLANGGPVRWNDATLHGNLHIHQDEEITLLSEDLKIKVLNENSYSVEASYVLANKGSAKKMQFGVPVTWQNEFGGLEESGVWGLQVLIEQQSYMCKKVILAGTSAAFSKEKQINWCVFALDMPKKNEIPLKLTYQGKFEFTDWATNKSPKILYDARVLRYKLWPAGYWDGNAKSVRIEVDLGQLAPYAKVKGPLGFKRNHRTVLWKMQNINLINAKDIEIHFELAEYLQSR